MIKSPELENQFDAEFSRHQHRIYRFVAVLLPDRDVAEEVFQQTCFVLLKSRDKYDPQRDFLAWAQGVARNVVREHARATRRLRLELSDELIERLAGAQAKLGATLDNRLSALGGCMQKLSPRDKALLERCYAGAEKIRDIAVQLQLAPTILYKRLDRLRWTLAECIERAVSREERS